MLKVKKLVALVLALILALPVSVFAAQNDISSAGTEDMDLQEFIEMAKELRKENSKKLGDNVSKLESLVKEGNKSAINENAVKEEAYFKSDEKVRIIVEVGGRPVRDLRSSSAVNRLKSSQASVMAAIEDCGIKADIRHRFFKGINGFSAEVKYSDVKAIRNLPGVNKVYISRKYKIDLDTSRGMVNADVVNAAPYNLKGEGTLIAIIDTGIDWTHQDLSNISDPAKAKYADEASIQSILNATEIDDIWYNEKVVSGYDWADMDDNVIPDLTKPLASPHGVHVAGIAAANGDILGVAPEAQLLAEKVFSDADEYAYDDDIIAGIQHAVAFGADVINMSLGSTAGFVGDDDPIQVMLQDASDSGVVACVSAGNSGYNTKGLYYPYAQNPDIGLVGSPGVGVATIQVAAMENNMVVASSLDYYYDGVLQGSGIYQTAGNIDPSAMSGIKLVDCGLGYPEDFTDEVKAELDGNVALIERGVITFAEKQINAQNAGAVGVVIYNHEDGGDGLISMATHEELAIPAVFVGRTTGLAFLDGIDVGKEVSLEFSGEVTSINNPVAGQMMDGSSWGLTPNLDFKPEITAPGGNIYSTVNDDKYETMSGTSMSSPHAAGAAALVIQYLKSLGMMDSPLSTAKALLMSTSEPITDPISTDGTPYSPRLQGAGLMQIDKAVSTPVMAYGSSIGSGASLKEIGYGNDPDKEIFPVVLTSLGPGTVAEAVYYNVYADIYTDFVSDCGYEGYEFNVLETTPVDGAGLELNGSSVLNTVYETVYVEKGSSIQLDFTLDLSEADIPTESFVEGFIRFVPTDANPDVPALTVPYVGFYGDWDKPDNVDPAIWEFDSYWGYTGLYDAVPAYDEAGEFIGYYLYQLGEDYANGYIDPDKVAISPDDDEMQDVGSTVFTLLRNAKRFKLYVEDESGNQVKEIFDNLTWENKEGITEFKEGVRKNSTYSTGIWYTFLPETFDWDGTSDDGSIVADGQYNVVMETTIDYPDAQSQRYELSVKVDTVDPFVRRLKVKHIAEGYHISWENSDDYSGIAYSVLYIDGVYYDTFDAETNSVIVDERPKKVVVVTFDNAGNADATRASDNDDDDKNGEGGKGGPAASGEQTVTAGKPVVAPVPELNPNTKEAVTGLNAETLKKALSVAAANKEGIKEVVVKVPEVSGAEEYTLTIPSAMFASGSEAAAVIQMQTALGTVSIPDNMPTPELAAQGANIGISLGLADTEALSPELKAQLGDKPVFQLNLKINGVKKEWNNPDAAVTVSVDYAPTAEELKNPDNIVIWYIDGEGNVVSVPSGKYDPATGKVTFTVNHFSKYAVAYVKPVLSDIGAAAWANKEINAMVAKGIMKPASKTEFDPKTNITRADFIYGLVRALGLSCTIEGNFSDISPADYCYNEVGTAKKLGIITGVGDNKFDPDSSITRQDMMTMTARAMKVAKKLQAEGSEEDLGKFADNAKIASYARTSIAGVVSAGIILGDGANINPLGNTSRAEAAVIMYRLYNK